MSKFPITLNAETAQAVARMASEPTRASLNVSGTGVGKTVMAVELSRQIAAQSILIVSPVNTETNWQVHFEGQGVALPFRKIDSSLTGKAAYGNLIWNVPGIYFVGTEMFARMGSESYVDRAGKKRRRTTKMWEPITTDMVIMDESHRASNAKTATYLALSALQKVGYKHAMSATPSGNNFEGAYPVAEWLWPLHPSILPGFAFWKEVYCETVYDHFKWDHKKTVGEKVPGRFYAELPCVVKMPSPEIPIFEDTEYVELTPKQRKQYNELEDELFTYFGEHPYEVEYPSSLHIRLRQATLGELTFDEDGNVSFDENCRSSKIDRMWTVLEDTFEGESALIGVGTSRRFARVVAARLNQKWPGSAALWTGGMKQTTRDQIMQDFIDGKVKYVVAVISALAEGADGLQLGTRNMLWFDKSLSGILNTQFLGRVKRQGVKGGTVRSITLEARNTKDQETYQNLADQEIGRRKSLALTRATETDMVGERG